MDPKQITKYAAIGFTVLSAIVLMIWKVDLKAAVCSDSAPAAVEVVK